MRNSTGFGIWKSMMECADLRWVKVEDGRVEFEGIGRLVVSLGSRNPDGAGIGLEF